jgi:4-hydroxy-3-methylbut-2-enyl diphosphate reductase
MRITLARSAGFCSGVRSAVIKISRSLSILSNISIDGELIHNPQTTEALRKRGLATVAKGDTPSGPVAIRTHGTTEEDLKKKAAASSRLINLTCPRVAKIQGIIKKHARDGFHVIISGDANHAEVISLKSYAGAGFTVVNTSDDLSIVPGAARYLLVSQTTFEKNTFQEIKTKAESLFPGIIVISTICDSTYRRQNEVEDAILRGIDTLVVVGGKGSANTKSLARIGISHDIHTIHIETESDLSYDDIKTSRQVFVTAGASTPRWVVDRVLEKIDAIRFRRHSKALGVAYKIVTSMPSVFLFSVIAFGLIVHILINNSASIKISASLCLIYLSLISSQFLEERTYFEIMNSGQKTSTHHITFLFLFAFFTAVVGGSLLFTVNIISTLATLPCFIAIPLFHFRRIRSIKNRIPGIIIVMAFLLISMITALSSTGSIYFSLVVSFSAIFTLFLILTPSDIVSTENDMIVGRPSLLLIVGEPLFIILLATLGILSSLVVMSLKIPVLYIALPASCFFLSVFSLLRRPLYPSRLRIIQSLIPVIIAIIIILFG